MGNPLNVRLNPGILYAATVGADEPTDLATPWPMAWAEIGYTDEGSTFAFSNTFEDVFVAEELDPILTLQTERRVEVSFASAEITAANLQRALNGGTITTPAGLIVFEPPAVGDYTHIALGWESDDGLERWIFRKCLQVGSASMARQKAPNKATLAMTFRALKPDPDEHDVVAPVFKFIQDADYVAA